MCGNLSIAQILPAPEWFELRMGWRKGGGGWIGWLSARQELQFDRPASLGRRAWQNFRVFHVRKWEEWEQCIFDCTGCHCRVQHKPMLEKHMRSEHWKGQKSRVALTVSVKIPLSHRVHISPFSPLWMNTSIFCLKTSWQINRFLLLSRGPASKLVPSLSLMLVLLVLLKWLAGGVIKGLVFHALFNALSWQNFSPLCSCPIFCVGEFLAPFWQVRVCESEQICTNKFSHFGSEVP